MKLISVALLAVAAVSLPSASSAETLSGFIVGVSNAPPAPKVVFTQAPRMLVVPSTKVYVVDRGHNDDIFRSGSTWYIYRSGYWYRSASHAGPWVVVDVRRVPRAVIDVPPRYWKRHPHGAPPGQVKKASSPGKGKSQGSKGHKG